MSRGAPTPETRLTMAQALAETFWHLADEPKRWRDHTADQQVVWLAMADAAFDTGRKLRERGHLLREIAA